MGIEGTGYNLVGSLLPLDLNVATEREICPNENKCLKNKEGEVVLRHLEVEKVSYWREAPKRSSRKKGKKEGVPKNDLVSFKLLYEVNPRFHLGGQEFQTAVELRSGKGGNEINIVLNQVEGLIQAQVTEEGEKWKTPPVTLPTKIDLTEFISDYEPSVPIRLNIRGPAQGILCSGILYAGKSIEITCKR